MPIVSASANVLATAKVSTLPDISVAHSLIQMVIALVVIVGCIWGFGKLLARLRTKGPSTKRKVASNGLSVISRQTLGKDLAIATVQWGEREVLVGIAGSTITFLTDPKTGEPAAREPEETPQPVQFVNAAGAPFAAAVRQQSAALVAQTPRVPAGSLVEALRNATSRH